MKRTKLTRTYTNIKVKKIADPQIDVFVDKGRVLGTGMKEKRSSLLYHYY